MILEAIEYFLETWLGNAFLLGVQFMTLFMFIVLSITAVAYTAKSIRFAWDWRNTDRREAVDLIILTTIMAFGAFPFGVLSLHYLADLMVWVRAW